MVVFRCSDTHFCVALEIIVTLMVDHHNQHTRSSFKKHFKRKTINNNGLGISTVFSVCLCLPVKSHNNAQERGIHYPEAKDLPLKWKLPQIRVNEGQLKTLIGTKRDKAFKDLSAENNCTYYMTNADLREYIYEN